MQTKLSRSDTLQEEVHRVELEGGLNVFYCPKPGFRKKYACYATHYGSVDSVFRGPGESAQSSVPDGIAHFLEHTLFETEKGNVSDLFGRNGAYNNASTSFSTTSYLFASSDRFYDNLGLLVDFVENPVFDPKKVEKEKGIIEQEILRYQDEPGWVGYMGLLESLFVDHPLRIDIAGTVESIYQIDSETLHRCYRTFYNPRNMILFIIGDLDVEEVYEFVDGRSRHGAAKTSHGDGAAGFDIDRVFPDEPVGVASESFEREMEVALPKLIVGFKETNVPVHGNDLLQRELTTEFALDLLLGRSSDAYTDLYEQQLILDDFSSYYYACAGVGFVAMGGETPNPHGLRRALDAYLGKARNQGFAADDFERQKRKYIGGFIRSFNSLEFIASNYTYYRFHDLDLFDLIDAFESITQEAVEARIQTLFDPKRQAYSLISPRS
jgi:predicted Zn-dependent peptidase